MQFKFVKLCGHEWSYLPSSYSSLFNTFSWKLFKIYFFLTHSLFDQYIIFALIVDSLMKDHLKIEQKVVSTGVVLGEAVVNTEVGKKKNLKQS